MHLVLGGTGGFGSAMVRALLARGERVRVLARRPADAHLPPGVEVVPGDVFEMRTVVDAAKGCDSLTHAINLPYPEWDPGMLRVTDNVVEAASLTGATLVFPGNTYGLKPIYDVPLPVEAQPRDTNDRPCKKGLLRNFMEDQLRQNAELRNLRTLIVRTGELFGERIDNRLVGEMFRSALTGKPIPWYVSPDIGHTFTWTDDAARVAAGALALPNRPVFEILHVEGHLFPNASAWGKALAAAAGVPFGGVRTVAPWQVRLYGLIDREAREFAEMLFQWEGVLRLDDARTRALLPDWTPAPLDDALRATMAWFRDPVR
jgi:nucleoside-diphosphate-sugar epimerase